MQAYIKLKNRMEYIKELNSHQMQEYEDHRKTLHTPKRVFKNRGYLLFYFSYLNKRSQSSLRLFIVRR